MYIQLYYNLLYRSDHTILPILKLESLTRILYTMIIYYIKYPILIHRVGIKYNIPTIIEYNFLRQF